MRRDGKILFHAPANGFGGCGEFAPEFSGFRGARQNQAVDAAAADEEQYATERDTT